MVLSVFSDVVGWNGFLYRYHLFVTGLKGYNYEIGTINVQQSALMCTINVLDVYLRVEFNVTAGRRIRMSLEYYLLGE